MWDWCLQLQYENFESVVLWQPQADFRFAISAGWPCSRVASRGTWQRTKTQSLQLWVAATVHSEVEWVSLSSLQQGMAGPRICHATISSACGNLAANRRIFSASSRHVLAGICLLVILSSNALQNCRFRIMAVARRFTWRRTVLHSKVESQQNYTGGPNRSKHSNMRHSCLHQGSPGLSRYHPPPLVSLSTTSPGLRPQVLQLLSHHPRATTLSRRFWTLTTSIAYRQVTVRFEWPVPHTLPDAGLVFQSHFGWAFWRTCSTQSGLKCRTLDVF